MYEIIILREDLEKCNDTINTFDHSHTKINAIVIRDKKYYRIHVTESDQYNAKELALELMQYHAIED